MTFDAVLPVIARDVERCKLLFRSIEKYFSDLGTLWILTPEDQIDFVRRELKHPRAQVVPELSIAPELRLHPRARSWFKQQLLKLAMANHVQTDYFLLLDCDVIATKPVTYERLVPNGRANCRVFHDNRWEEWYDWAKEALQLTPVRRNIHHNVTPAVLHREAVIKLQGHFNELASRAPFGLKRKPMMRWLGRTAFDLMRGPKCAPYAPWRKYLIHHLPWTEYSMYYTYLEATGQFEKYHRETGAEGSYYSVHSVWKRSDVETWNPAAAFSEDDPSMFLVFQSNLKLPVELVREKVGAYLR